MPCIFKKMVWQSLLHGKINLNIKYTSVININETTKAHGRVSKKGQKNYIVMSGASVSKHRKILKRKNKSCNLKCQLNSFTKAYIVKEDKFKHENDMNDHFTKNMKNSMDPFI